LRSGGRNHALRFLGGSRDGSGGEVLYQGPHDAGTEGRGGKGDQDEQPNFDLHDSASSANATKYDASRHSDLQGNCSRPTIDYESSPNRATCRGMWRAVFSKDSAKARSVFAHKEQKVHGTVAVLH
jgi:hypothetical protein